MPNITVGNTVSSSNQLGNDVVTSPKILNDTITTDDIGANGVGNSEIAAHTTTKISVPLANLLNATGAQGDVAYWNGSNWVRLPPGNAGQFLMSGGAGANPSWGSPSGKLYVSSTQTTINNTTTETNIFNFTLAGGSLGTTGAIKGRVNIGAIVGSGAAINFTYRLYYGTTVIASLVHNESGAASNGFIDFQIFANASASAQRGTFLLLLGNSNIMAAAPARIETARGTATENSANPLAVRMTLQMATANAAYGKTIESVYVTTV